LLPRRAGRATSVSLDAAREGATKLVILDERLINTARGPIIDEPRRADQGARGSGPSRPSSAAAVQTLTGAPLRPSYAAALGASLHRAKS
jgi:hypothetical protein